MNKICKKCNQVKSLNDFYTDTHSKDGKTYTCKECITEYRNRNKEKNRLYQEIRRLENNQKVCEIRRNSWRNLDPRKKLYQQSKSRALRKNIEFSISINDIIIPDKCPLLNVPFIIGTKNNYEYTHSLDRIDNSKGYIPGNIWVISKKANSMKNSANKEELLYFAQQILNTFK